MRGIISDLHWQADFNGYECGYPEINVIGVYTSHKLQVDLLIDTETREVLEVVPLEYDE